MGLLDGQIQNLQNHTLGAGVNINFIKCPEGAPGSRGHGCPDCTPSVGLSALTSLVSARASQQPSP